MLDRFTDRARKVMSMAKQEALDLHSNKVGTEHLLLALAKEDEGIAAEALRSLDISYDDIMDTLKEVQTTVPEPSEETEAAKLAFTPLVISVMERSFRVARENNQTYVSTEHLLIGIVEEDNGMAMDILMRLGVSSASIKKAIEKLTAKDQDKKRPLAGAGAGRPGAGLPFFSGSDASQHQEQSAYLGRPRRGQDGHRRGSGSADCSWQRAREPHEPEYLDARPAGSRCGCQVSR